MSLFFQFQSPSDWKPTIGIAQWHPAHKLFAVATKEFLHGVGGSIIIYKEDAVPLTKFSVEYKGDKDAAKGGAAAEGGADSKAMKELQHPTCEAMDWHPELKTLVFGCCDGSVYIWTADELAEGVLKEVTGCPHKGRSVSLLAFSAAGDRVVSGDSNGTWQVWKFERNTLTPLHSNVGKEPWDGALTHCALRTPKHLPKLNSSHPDGEGGDRVDSAMQRLMVEDEEGMDYGHNSGTFASVTKFKEDCTWFIGGSSGTVWGVDDEGANGVIFNCDNLPITSLLCHQTKTGLVAMNQNCGVSYYLMLDDGRWVQHARFRFSLGKNANASTARMLWCGHGLLATVAGESMVRLWNVDQNENYVLHVEDTQRMVEERVQAISYSSRRRTLAVGTMSGRVVIWRYNGPASSVSEDDWSISAGSTVEKAVLRLYYGPTESLLSAIVPDGVVILHASAMQRAFARNMCVVQQTPDTLYYEDLGMNVSYTITSKLHIKEVGLAGSYVAASSLSQVELFHVQLGSAVSVGVVDVEHVALALHGDKMMVARTDRGVSSIQLYNMQLQKSSHVSIKAHEGEVLCLSCSGDHLAVATSRHFVSCWWIGGRSGEEKVHGYARQMWTDSSYVIEKIALNPSGGQVAVLAKAAEGSELELFIVDVEHDTMQAFDFQALGRSPTSVTWDQFEPKLLACETLRRRDPNSGKTEADDDKEKDPSAVEVVTLFSSERGIKVQEKFAVDKSHLVLVGVSVPNLHFYKRTPAKMANDLLKTTNLAQRVMRDFEGIDCSEPRVREALLDFSYNLACGDMDAAYRAVKLIRDENVWCNMAQVCVKTGRLDVAEVCLGNMQDAKGAAALREAKKEPEPEAHVAMLALQLGLLDEAEELYKKCGRYDLLNVMHQACGKWSEAIEIAERHDRIHLRSVHYRYARHLESVGEVLAAVKQYEKAKCNGYEVPRMLYGAGMLKELEDYAMTNNEKEVFRWWGKYSETYEQYEQALQFYKEAGDVLSRARLLCHLNDKEGAAALVTTPETSRDTAAASYHLARRYEDAGKLKESLHFYRAARAYKNAIRIARQNNMAAEVMQLSLQADPSTLLESAEWFEEQGQLPKAVVLYKKGGELAKAIDLCVRGQLFDTLQKLADDLGPETDPEVYIQCAEFFVNEKQHEKAVRMYVNAKGFSEALQVCLDHDVKLTEEMAEEMTLPKTDNEDDEALRLNLLRKVARVAKVQESWHLACKKYTQAGDRIKGMKVLLKSGDTDKIIFFTNHSRQKDIYILAAHYLQTIDWHNNSHITKNIITFYTKARAYESLSGFYDAVAQVYIDEFRDYDKALGALQDSVKYMEKSKANNRDAKMQQLESKVAHVEKFVEARNMVKSDPAKMVESCRALLDIEDIEAAVRVGDIFALLVEFYTGRQEFEQAYHLIEQMRDRQIVLPLFLESQLVQAVYNAMGVEYVEHDANQGGAHAGGAAAAPEDVPDEVDHEDIPEDQGGAQGEEWVGGDNEPSD